MNLPLVDLPHLASFNRSPIRISSLDSPSATPPPPLAWRPRPPSRRSARTTGPMRSPPRCARRPDLFRDRPWARASAGLAPAEPVPRIPAPVRNRPRSATVPKLGPGSPGAGSSAPPAARRDRLRYRFLRPASHDPVRRLRHRQPPAGWRAPGSNAFKTLRTRRLASTSSRTLSGFRPSPGRCGEGRPTCVLRHGSRRVCLCGLRRPPCRRRLTARLRPTARTGSARRRRFSQDRRRSGRRAPGQVAGPPPARPNRLADRRRCPPGANAR